MTTCAACKEEFVGEKLNQTEYGLLCDTCNAKGVESCAQCGQALPVAKLNISSQGLVCDLCEADTKGNELSASTFNRVRGAATAALVLNILSVVISVRLSKSSSINGHGTLTLRADMPGLLFSGLSLIIILSGFFFVWTAKGIDLSPEESKQMAKQKLLYTLILLVLGIWGLYEFLDALPSKTSF